jgi:acetolactate synthase-1/2/3 large subunit
VHLTIPVDVLRDDFKDTYIKDRKTSRGDSSLEATSIHCISKALNAIETAEKPLLIAGSGVFYSKGSDAIEKFCGATSIPVMIPVWDRGTIEERIPNFLGVIGAASGSPSIMEDADLVILAGVKVDYRLGFMVPPAVRKDATLIRIDVDPAQLRQGVDPDISILSSPKHVFELFTERINEKGSSFKGAGEWLEETQNRLNVFRKRWFEREPQEYVTGLELVKAIRPALSDDPVLLVDGGNIGQWAHMVLGDRYPGRWLTCGASGVVGWGIPGAIGAKLAYPEDPILLLSGDGAFGFTVAEIESAVKHKTPFVAVVANDCGWGIVISSQLESRGDKSTIASRFSDIRYDKVAEGFGARGFRVENLERLTGVIKEGFSADVPTIIDVPIKVSRPSDFKI